MMKDFTLTVLVFFSCLTTTASAMSLTKRNISKCNIPFTQEQRKVLDMAYIIGSEYDLGNTLQAIVIQESFVYRSIHRVREVSVYDTSYGIFHIRPVVGTWIASKTNLYKITEGEVKPLLSDKEGDILSVNLALQLLLRYQRLGDSWRTSVARYNGGKYYKGTQAQRYVRSVINNIKYLKRCTVY